MPTINKRPEGKKPKIRPRGQGIIHSKDVIWCEYTPPQEVEDEDDEMLIVRRNCSRCGAPPTMAVRCPYCGGLY